MTYYLLIKYIHILSSTILFGTGIGTASVMLYGHLTKDPYTIAQINKYVVIADSLFTAPTMIIQPLSGLLMVYMLEFSIFSYWIWVSLISYLFALLCWLPVVFLQIRLRNIAIIASKRGRALPKLYFRYFTYWFVLGWPAFFLFCFIFYLMVFKPM